MARVAPGVIAAPGQEDWFYLRPEDLEIEAVSRWRDGRGPLRVRRGAGANQRQQYRGDR